MKVLTYLLLTVTVVFLFESCSNDDEYCDIKGDLLGTWVNIENDDDFIIFKEDNTFAKQSSNAYTNYGFTTLDSLVILSDDRIISEHYFEFRDKEKFFIESFSSVNGQMVDVTYKRPK